MIVVPHRHVMILLKGLEALGCGYLAGETWLICSKGHFHIHKLLLLLLKAEGVHGGLGWVLAEAQSAHGSVETGLTIVEAGKLEIRLEVEEL